MSRDYSRFAMMLAMILFIAVCLPFWAAAPAAPIVLPAFLLGMSAAAALLIIDEKEIALFVAFATGHATFPIKSGAAALSDFPLLIAVSLVALLYCAVWLWRDARSDREKVKNS